MLFRSHRTRTAALINKVIVPIVRLIFNEIPWASTLHGDAPVNETINNPSPRPNKVNPKHRKKNVEILGFKLNGFLELQFVLGIFLIDKNMRN